MYPAVAFLRLLVLAFDPKYGADTAQQYHSDLVPRLGPWHAVHVAFPSCSCRHLVRREVLQQARKMALRGGRTNATQPSSSLATNSLVPDWYYLEAEKKGHSGNSAQGLKDFIKARTVFAYVRMGCC